MPSKVRWHHLSSRPTAQRDQTAPLRVGPWHKRLRKGLTLSISQYEYRCLREPSLDSGSFSCFSDKGKGRKGLCECMAEEDKLPSTRRKAWWQEDERRCVAHLLLSIQSGNLAQGTELPSCRVDLPSSVKSTEK